MNGVELGFDQRQQDASAATQTVAVDYEHSGNLANVLQSLNLSVLLSTYQAGKLVVVGSLAGNTTLAFHSFDQVMGIASDRGQIAVGTRRQIHILRGSHEVARTLAPVGNFDGCYLARNSFVTGSIHGHDLAFGNEGLWVVNTLFSCLCTLDGDYNFYPRWRPNFVTQLIDQDRCHLNGLALEDGEPRFVTVLGVTDEPAGWRVNKRSGGAIIDIPTGEVISRGLCMPHSPRIHQGALWVLNSGRGELSKVDLATGDLEVVANLPGYTRGLSFYGDYAFIGLSRIRETNIFGGLPIGEHPERLQCGLGIVDIKRGVTVATLQFKSGVEELFAVEVLPGVLNPKVSGPSSIPGEEDEIWIVPPLQSQTMPRRSVGGKVGPAAHSVLNASGVRKVKQVDGQYVDEVLRQQSGSAELTGDADEAFLLVKQAVASDPNSVFALNRLGNMYQDRNEKEKAIACYEKAVQVNPLFSSAHQNLGVLRVANNEPLRALHHFERCSRDRQTR